LRISKQYKPLFLDLKLIKLRADELYLIALAIDVNPHELLDYVCGELKLGK
jgi:hypothetical protein